jgi:tetratricopeptide (TPR) repeat protein
LLDVASPRPAAAQSVADVEAARASFIDATRLANQGRWSEAMELYAYSLRLRPAPITRYSLGVAQKQTGHFAAALGSFHAFLAEPEVPATAPYRAPARAAIAELEPKVERGGPGPASPADGTAPVDGRAAPPGSALPPAPEAHTRTLPIVLMGCGGALFSAGLTVGLVGMNQASHATTRDGADAHAARAKALAGDVLGGVGLAAAGVGLVLWFIQGRPAAPPAGAARSTTPAGLVLRF